jgi:hypothetical protein
MQIVFTNYPLPDVFPLAITLPYSQEPIGGLPLAGRTPLAYNGKMIDYRQYISPGIWVFVTRRV